MSARAPLTGPAPEERERSGARALPLLATGGLCSAPVSKILACLPAFSKSRRQGNMLRVRRARISSSVPCSGRRKKRLWKYLLEVGKNKRSAVGIGAVVPASFSLSCRCFLHLSLSFLICYMGSQEEINLSQVSL